MAGLSAIPDDFVSKDFLLSRCVCLTAGAGPDEGGSYKECDDEHT